jgi:hypothetical protein
MRKYQVKIKVEIPGQTYSDLKGTLDENNGASTI